jgi:hypothetical protein
VFIVSPIWLWPRVFVTVYGDAPAAAPMGSAAARKTDKAKRLIWPAHFARWG